MQKIMLFYMYKKQNLKKLRISRHFDFTICQSGASSGKQALVPISTISIFSKVTLTNHQINQKWKIYVILRKYLQWEAKWIVFYPQICVKSSVVFWNMQNFQEQKFSKIRIFTNKCSYKKPSHSNISISLIQEIHIMIY